MTPTNGNSSFSDNREWDALDQKLDDNFIFEGNPNFDPFPISTEDTCEKENAGQSHS